MEEFGKQLANQNIPDWSVLPLLWLIPYGELVITFLLIFERTRCMGLYGSAFFMLLFTGYIGLVLLNVQGTINVPSGSADSRKFAFVSYLVH